MTLNIPSEKQKVLKDRIIHVLASEWPIPVKKIYTNVKKQGFNVSYQAVYKAMQELLSDGVLEKEGRDYKLSMDWIEGVESFGKKLKSSYAGGRIPTIDEIISKDMTAVRFNTIYKCYEFLIYILEDLSKIYNKVGIVSLRHLYWPLSASEEVFNQFKRTSHSHENIYIVASGKTIIDKIIAKVYESTSKNMHVKLGIDYVNDFDVFVSGDFVIQIYFDEKIKKKLHDSYLKTKILDSVGLSKLYETTFGKKAEINLVILRNPRLAEQIRNKVLGYFKD